MEQKFIKLEDAAEKLGVPPERLNDLRENGQLRAYRDGPSWKFRTDEIEKLCEEGLPEPPPDSDIGFGLLGDEELTPLGAEDSGLELELEGTDPVSQGSELESELDDLEDTVTAGASDVQLASASDSASEKPSDPSDSILLSDEELGESAGPSGSTIVGKDVLQADADLELASDSKSPAAPSPTSGASHVLSSDSTSDDVLDSLELENSDAGASGFEDLEELEIDLAAESSRILSPDELSSVQAAASLPVSGQGGSDLALDDSSDVDSEMGSTDVPLLDTGSSSSPLEGGSGSEIELADDDLVLSGSDGSDVTLGSSDSGINLAPADSGLALDDIPLEIGGSAILSSLDLGGDSDPEISLVGSAPEATEDAPEAELEIEEDFQLTPLSQGAADDGDSSSQVIALDADIDDLEQDVLGDDVGVLEEDVDFTEDGGDVMVADDFGAAAEGDLEMGTYAGGGAAAISAELPYSIGQVIGLGSCAVMMALGGVMMLDMMRNIWSWNEPYSLSSTLIESILGLF